MISLSAVLLFIALPALPSICHILQYMVQRLRVLDGRVVGVVGLGHLDGLERRWQQLGGQKLGS